MATTFTVPKLARMREKIDQQRRRDPEHPALDKLETEYAKRRSDLAADLGVSETEVDARVHEDTYGFRPGEEPPSDEIIGKAFRWSLTGILAVVLLGALVFWIAQRPEEAPPVHEIAVAAPEAVEAPALEPPALPFTDVTGEAGIDFVHESGAYGDKLLPETMGGGVAFFDYDGDGDADLLFVNGTAWPGAEGSPATQALYANDGNGSFTDVTAQAGLDVSLYGMGPAAADFDADGDLDLYLTAVGENRLFRNDGGRFTDVTGPLGVGGDPDAWSTCATFFDADGDRDLDLFVCNYIRWSKEIDFEVDYRLTGVGRAYGPPANYQGTYSTLFRQEDDGTFTDVSAEAGIQIDNPATGLPAGKALGVATVDADEDGDLDVFVANDTVGNFFFVNQGDGTFVEQGAPLGLAYDRMGAATGAMGVDVGHLRDDRNLAFVIGNFANEMTSFYVAQGTSDLYADEAISSGLGAPSRTRLTFGMLLMDADVDGRLDLVQTNGHLEDEIAQVDPSQSFRQSAQVFWNAGPEAARTFVPVPDDELGDLPRPIVGRGSAYADMDGDGDLDVVMTQIGGPPLLLRNDQATGHHWLRVKLEQDDPNPDALGAWVELTVDGVPQRRVVTTARSYLSQSEIPITFGLGESTSVEALEVTWPDGTVQSVDVSDLEVDRELVVRRE